MLLRQIFDGQLSQYAYLIGCQKTGHALVIDPERDIDRYVQLALENKLKITAVLETHIHADFVSGAREFAQDPSIHLYLSAEGGAEWSYHWPKDRPNTHLLKNKEHFMVGNIRVEAIWTPGHTPEHLCFLITDLGGNASEPMALISGDFIFVGDVGRPDLLETAAGKANVKESSARQLHQSLTECLKGCGDYLLLLPAHGAGSACGKGLAAIPMSTLGYERRFNPALKLAQKGEEAFVTEILVDQPDPPLYFANMKRVNRDGIRVTGGIPKPSKCTVEQFSALAKDANSKVLDARNSPEEFDAGHFKNAYFTPLNAPLFSNAAGSFLEENDNILLIVKSEVDAEQASRQLYRIGFDNIKGWIFAEELSTAGLLNEKIPKIEARNFNLESACKEGKIIDVRMASEYQAKHLEGASLIPYTRLKAHMAELPRNEKLFVHCASGMRARAASSFLQAAGFNVIHVNGTVVK